MSAKVSWGRRFDVLVLPLLELVAFAAVVAAFVTGSIPTPFPVLEFLVLVAVGASLRRFGLPLPGKGFASFIMLLPLFAILHRGWGWAAFVSVVAVLVGDLLLRRLPFRAGAATAGMRARAPAAAAAAPAVLIANVARIIYSMAAVSDPHPAVPMRPVKEAKTHIACRPV